MTGLNFDTLAVNPEFEAPPQSGKPLDLLISDIAENPDNPRTEYDEDYLHGLADDISANGVKSPVSVRANPTGKTKWMLNYGACRRRASILADKDIIPGFIDEQFTDYDAVSENEQRRNLSAMELALFIQKRKTEHGESNIEIAGKLHKDKQAITHHLALIDMPEAIDKAYREQRVTAARVIYDLVQLHKKHGDKVAQWCADNESITRTGVSAFAKQLKAVDKPPETPQEPVTPVQAQSDTSKPVKTPQKCSEAAKPAQPDYEVSKFAELPTISVVVNNRQAVIQLERKPTARGMVFVKYLDDDSVGEVKGNSCVIMELVESGEEVGQVAEVST